MSSSGILITISDKIVQLEICGIVSSTLLLLHCWSFKVFTCAFPLLFLFLFYWDKLYWYLFFPWCQSFFRRISFFIHWVDYIESFFIFLLNHCRKFSGLVNFCNFSDMMVSEPKFINHLMALCAFFLEMGMKQQWDFLI